MYQYYKLIIEAIDSRHELGVLTSSRSLCMSFRYHLKRRIFRLIIRSSDLSMSVCSNEQSLR